MKRILLIFTMSLLLISFTAAACPDGEGYLGNKDYDSCVRISQTCASCTSVNISSIVLSTSNKTLISNVTMTNVGNGEWTYHFCNTTSFGNYYIQGQGDLDGTVASFKSCFDIGQNLSVGESIIYCLFTGVLFFILLSMFYFIIILPSDNDRNEKNIIIGIVKLKYLRVFLIAICYPILMIILNLMNGLAVNFASLDIFAGTLGFLFETMLRGAWFFTIVIVLWMIYLLIHDSNVMKNINRLGRFKVNG